MKVKRMLIFILACAMLMGEAVCAQEMEENVDEKTRVENVQEPIEVESVQGIEETLKPESVENAEVLEDSKASGEDEVSTVDEDEQVTVTGISAEQEVGETMTGTVTALYYGSDYIRAVLKENGELWQYDPEVKKLMDNVQSICSASYYVLKKDGTLWDCSGEENLLLMDNVKDITGYNEEIVYVCKNDGTLWNAALDKLEEGAEFQLEDTDVVQLESWGYLQSDGTVHHFNGYGETRQDVEYIVDQGYYVEDDGFYYDISNSGGLMYGLANNKCLCDKRVIDISTYGHYYQDDNGKNTQYIMALTEDGEVWAFEDEHYGENTIYCGSNGKQLLVTGEADWMDNEGNYYALDQEIEATEESPIMVEQWNPYCLEDYGTNNEYYLVKNGVKILDHVVELLGVDFYTDECWVIRTDGTIWKVTDELVQLGTVNVMPDYIMGDINTDGEVNLLDLMLCLNHVSKKSMIEDTAFSAADIDENGVVNLLDLMRILNYVSKKTSEL